jgi:hypothetical protein
MYFWSEYGFDGIKKSFADSNFDLDHNSAMSRVLWWLRRTEISAR